jgi:anti-anti-sigma regulatory factor
VFTLPGRCRIPPVAEVAFDALPGQTRNIMDALRVRIDALDEATLVTAAGTLNAATSSKLRTALHKCLVESPTALILELTEVVVTEPTALALLPAVARQASMWPGLPFAVVVQRGPVAEAIRRRGSARSFPVRETTVEALAAVAEVAAQPAVREFLPPLTGAARHARTVVTSACIQWRLDHMVGPACVVVSELVANATRHAGTTMTLRLSRRPRYLLIAVQDGSEEIPRMLPTPADDDPSPGRGLTLVQGVAFRWGWLPTDSGKVVWAVLRT